MKVQFVLLADGINKAASGTINVLGEFNTLYFDYYRDYHASWKLYGIGLPDDVLKKVYYRNALRITPGLPQTGWPR